MEEIELKTQARNLNVKPKQLRKSGQVPAILYGHKVENVPLQVTIKDFQKVYRQAGTSSLLSLDLGKDKKTVLVQSVDRDPVSDQIIHVDFHQVNLTEKIKTEIPLQFVGEAPAIKELQGSLLTNKDHVKIEALPQDLVHEIKVDISGLKTFDDTISVKDLSIPTGISILEQPDEVVVTVQPPRSEEELAELEEEVKEDVEAVAVEEKGKVEEETVGGEQAAAAPADESTKRSTQEE